MLSGALAPRPRLASTHQRCINGLRPSAIIAISGQPCLLGAGPVNLQFATYINYTRGWLSMISRTTCTFAGFSIAGFERRVPHMTTSSTGLRSCLRRCRAKPIPQCPLTRKSQRRQREQCRREADDDEVGQLQIRRGQREIYDMETGAAGPSAPRTYRIISDTVF